MYKLAMAKPTFQYEDIAFKAWNVKIEVTSELNESKNNLSYQSELSLGDVSMPKLTFQFEDIDDNSCNINIQEIYYEEIF